MELKINRFGDLGSPITTAIMTHGDVEIPWDASVIEKTSFTGKFDIFEQLNGYWASQPKAKQDKIFDTYIRIKETFGSVWEHEQLTQRLYDLIAELLSYHELDDVSHYVSFYSNIRIPDTVKAAFIDSDDNPGTRERTYVKDDYHWLAVMTLALRAMIPVWGEYISRTEEETGTTYKEYYATRLLAKSNIIHTQAWEKLRVFVEHSLPADKSMVSAILGGISSEDFPFWILSLVVVRRLTVGDLRGIEPGASLVTFIYKYIGQRAKGHDANFIGAVKEKTLENHSQDGENNLSKLEGCKTKQEISAGDIVVQWFYASNVRAVAEKICPGIDPELLDQSMRSVRVLEGEQLWKPQIVLCQWVLRSALSPRGLELLEKKSVVDCIGIAQALLWHHGHKELAGLISAVTQTTKNGMSITGTNQRHRIPKELVEEINRHYPFARRAGKQNRPGKVVNSEAVQSVELVEKMFSEHDWRLTLPPKWVQELTGTSDQRYPVPADIKIKLAQLVLAIAKRVF